jgi:hypothetical protein
MWSAEAGEEVHTTPAIRYPYGSGRLAEIVTPKIAF